MEVKTENDGLKIINNRRRHKYNGFFFGGGSVSRIFQPFYTFFSKKRFELFISKYGPI